jgi:hypothetical protein
MAYVPGFNYDIFVSYAHITDEPNGFWKRGWVTTFCEHLQTLLRQNLDAGVSIWMDRKNLRTSDNYRSKIKAEVQSSALLLTINCDPYLNSIFSETEVKHFRESWLTVTPPGERRIVQIFQNIGPNRKIPAIDGDLNGHFFCGRRKNPGESGHPFPEDSSDYERALDVLGLELEELLYELRRNRQPIFLGPSGDMDVSEVSRLYADFKKQLSTRYRVETAPSFGKENEQAALNLLAQTAVSVHFLVGNFDKGSWTRIDAAIAAKKPCAVLAVGDMSDGPGADFLEHLEDISRDRPKDQFCIINVRPGQYTISDLVARIDELMPKTRAVEREKSQSLVYLVAADGTDVRKLRELLNRIEWLRLDPGKKAGDFIYDYEQIATCDGLLIVWTDNGTWFKTRYKKLSNERAYRRGEPYRSKAICVLPPPPEPPKPEGEIDPQDLLIKFLKDDDFKLATLEPFINRLKPQAVMEKKE